MSEAAIQTLYRGKYTKAQAESPVRVLSYAVIEEEGKRYLVLKCENKDGRTADGISFYLTQTDEKGRSLGTKRVDLRDIKGYSGEFVINRRIGIDTRCTAFSIRMISVRYGKYILKAGKKGAAALDYDVTEERPPCDIGSVKTRLKGKDFSVTERKRGVPAVMAVFSFILILGLLLTLYFRLDTFVNTVGKVYEYNGLLYEYTDKENYNSNVAITDYVGNDHIVTIPAQIEGHSVTEIKASAFSWNTKIVAVVFMGKVSVGDRAFMGCTNLSSITAMRLVTEIGEEAFAETGIEEISGATFTKLGAGAFANCSSLKTVVLPEGLHEVPERAFSHCVDLNDVTVSSTVTSIGELAFVGCMNLKTVMNHSKLDIQRGATGYGMIALYAETVFNPQ